MTSSNPDQLSPQCQLLPEQVKPRSLTRLNPPYLTPTPRLVPCHGVVVVEVEEVGVVEIVEVAVEAVRTRTKIIKTRLLRVRSIRERNIRIYQPGTGPGALCTSSGAGRHFSVRNRRHVHGRTSTPPSPARIERSTSSASLTQILNEYTKCCMIKGCQKYKI